MNRSIQISIKIAQVFVFGLVVLLFSPCSIECQVQSTSENLTVAPAASLDATAEKAAAVARKAGCGRMDCKILVSDLNTTLGSTSKFGIRFSDEFSQALVKFLPAGYVLDRSVLKDFLQEQRIPSNLLSEPLAARWLGKKLGATTVILPVLTFTRGSEVFFKLIKVDSDKVVESSELKVALATPSLEDLKAGEVYGSLNPRPLTTTEPTYEIGPKHPEVKFPQCFYAPYPPYSDSAKGLHFGGIVFIEAIISKDGHVEAPRVVRGLPFDLNEMALKTIATWRCRPAVLDGNPVRITIPFEITFRPN